MPLRLALCLALLAPTAVAAQDDLKTVTGSDAAAEPKPLSRTVVRRHLQTLAEGSATEQARAEQALLELGPGVLEVLAEFDVADATVRQAVDRVRAKLLQSEAEAAVRASTVTLKGEFKLADVLKALQTQTGNRIIDYREKFGQEIKNPTLTLDLTGAPFWVALDEILAQADLTLYGYPEQKGVAVVAHEAAAQRIAPPISDHGPFRVQAARLSAVRDLRNPLADQLLAQVQVFWEPRLSPISLELPLVTLEAEDEQGNALAARGIGVLDAEIAAGDYSTELALPFELPRRGVERIARIRGKVSALVPGQVDTYRFGILDRAKLPLIHERAGATVALQSIQENNDAWEVRVVVRFDKTSGALQSHRGWILRNVTYLELADKTQVEFETLETFRQTDNEVGIAYYYPLSADLKGATLVYKTPSIIMSLPIEFEIKNLKLP